MEPIKLLNFTNCGPWKTSGIDVDYKIDYIDGVKVLAFKPTDSFSDWLLNFDFPAVAYKDSLSKWYAHGGFLKAYKSVREELIPHYHGEPIIITGFSLGAALATLAHEDAWFITRGYGDFKTITFAGPRVIWMSRNIDSRFQGLTNYKANGDIVTYVPPKCLGFRDVGNTIYLGKKHFPSTKYHYPDYYRSLLGA